jgi:hypothetical protein
MPLIMVMSAHSIHNEAVTLHLQAQKQCRRVHIPNKMKLHIYKSKEQNFQSCMQYLTNHCKIALCVIDVLVTRMDRHISL